MTPLDVVPLTDVYVYQAAIVGVVVSAMVWRLGKIPRLQVMAWTLAVIVIYLRYGSYGQQVFYSNDQLHHAGLVDRFVEFGPPSELQWWVLTSRAPFVLPAILLVTAGLNTTLALKTVAGISYLYLTQLLIRVTPKLDGNARLLQLYMTAVGASGLFFSALALRETTMMLAVALFLLHPSPRIRSITIVALFLLRPHLAAALLVGWIMARVARAFRTQRWSPSYVVIVISIGATIGYFLFILGLELGLGHPNTVLHRGGIEPITRIASNLVGLQFITAEESTVSFSISSLLLYRLVMSETVVIPVIFLLTAFLATRFSELGRITLWSFSIYLGLVTNTAFNSFRQNIPLMPIMGLVVLLAWGGRRQNSAKRSYPPVTASSRVNYET